MSKVHFGFQSGSFLNRKEAPKNDDTFASGLHYDSKNNLIYVTGSTYSRFWDGVRTSGSTRDMTPLVKSDCFLTILEIPEDKKSKNSGNIDKAMKMVYARRFGKEETDEACSAVMNMPSVSTNIRAIALGNTQEGGLLTSLRTPGSRKATMYGFLLDFDIRLTKKQDKVEDVSGKVEGGQLIYDLPVQYPIAVTSDPLTSHAKEMFVALFASPIKSKNNVQQNVRPDLALSDDNTEYGSDFRVVIEMTESKTQATADYEATEIGEFEEGGVQETIVSGWKRSFSPTASTDTIPTLSVSDLEYVPRMYDDSADDVLVLTGTTNGHGTEFGGLDPTGSMTDSGFITKLSPTDGDIDPIRDRSVASTRIGVANAATSIKGICFQKGLVNVEYIYVVGFTKGSLPKSSMKNYQLSINKDNEISKHAFVTKLNLHDLEPVWSRQIGSQNGEDVTGYGCDVSPDGSTVFLAGTIENDGAIRYVDAVDIMFDLNSAGGDDIFVASYSTTGSTKFIRQLGTAEDDTFARGKGIVCDKNGDVIVLGNTRGSMMRLRGDHDGESQDSTPNDIFVMSIGKEKGKMRAIAEESPDIYLNGGSSNFYSDGEEAGQKLFTVEIVAITVSIAVMLFTIVYVLCSLRKVASDGTNWDSNDRVMNYLDEFNDDEVELHVRHSATGGVHGIYDFEVKNGVKIAQKPNEVSVSSEENENTRRSSNRLSKEESTKVLDTALFIVDSNKAKRSTEHESELQSGERSPSDENDPVESYDTSLNASNTNRLNTAVSTSSETAQASNIDESKSQFDSADDFILPDVIENENEDSDREII